jgi:cytochrome c peroxidase
LSALALIAAGAALSAANVRAAGAPGTQPAPESVAAYDWHLPRGFPTPAVPADNPMSEPKVALGRRLFFEPRLSITGHYSCGSCHDPARAFSDARPVAIGATGQALPHNAMALVNVAYNLSFGWTKPQVRSLEAQMLEPMLNQHPVELGMKGREATVSAELATDPAYARDFAAAFPGQAAPVSFGNLVKAIGAFERTLISGGSPFDRYVFGGEHEALSPQAKRGMAVFFSPRAGCAGCHSGFNFSGNWRDTQGATGRASFARNGTSKEPMRVPTLRNVALTAPYMHDGRFATLAAVLEHYCAIGARPGAHDPRLPRSPFTAAERAELLSFLQSLTDESFMSRFAASLAPAVP